MIADILWTYFLSASASSRLTIVLILSCKIFVAQNTKFEVVFGGAQYEYPRSVIQTSDKGFLVTGSTSSYGFGNSDVHVLKLDSAGNWQWETTFGGSNIEWGYAIAETPDSGYVLAGHTNSFGAGGYDIYAVRVDKYGAVLWNKTYGGTDWDFAFSIKNTYDGGFIITGSTYSFGAGDEDVYLIKIDGTGTEQWSKTYGGVNEDHGNSVVQAPDSGYIVTGYTNSYGAGDYDLYTIKVNASGDTVWTKTAGGISEDMGNACILTQDSNILVSGYSLSYGNAGTYDYYLMKYDPAGSVVWVLDSLGGSGEDLGYSLAELNNGDLAIVGSSTSFGQGMKDYLLYVLGAGGNFKGGGTYGGISDDIAYSVDACADNGLIIAGETKSYGKGLTDIYLLKTDSMGKSSGVIVVGLDEQFKNRNPFSTTVFPNPADDYFSFSMPENNILSRNSITLQVADISGRIIFEKEFNLSAANGVFNVETGDFKNGFYLLNVFSEEIKIVSEKIIIQH